LNVFETFTQIRTHTEGVGNVMLKRMFRSYKD